MTGFFGENKNHIDHTSIVFKAFMKIKNVGKYYFRVGGRKTRVLITP